MKIVFWYKLLMKMHCSKEEEPHTAPEFACYDDGWRISHEVAAGRRCLPQGHKACGTVRSSLPALAAEDNVKKKGCLKPDSEEPVVDPKLLQSAQEIVFEPKPLKVFACRVCGTEGATTQSEGLCWVCRHLKISAWREVDSPMTLIE